MKLELSSMLALPYQINQVSDILFHVKFIMSKVFDLKFLCNKSLENNQVGHVKVHVK